MPLFLTVDQSSNFTCLSVREVEGLWNERGVGSGEMAEGITHHLKQMLGGTGPATRDGGHPSCAFCSLPATHFRENSASDTDSPCIHLSLPLPLGFFLSNPSLTEY